MALFEAKKSGNGAFSVRVEDDGRTFVSIDGGAEQEFVSPQDAYDRCRVGVDECHGTMRGHAYFNAAYHLEDVLQKSVQS
jgi:hypothetical protein